MAKSSVFQSVNRLMIRQADSTPRFVDLMLTGNLYEFAVHLIFPMNSKNLTKTLLLLALIVQGCYAQIIPVSIQESFDNCYNGNTAIDSYLRIDGYYVDRKLERHCYGYGKSQHCTDTSYTYFMFFEDGTFLYNFSPTYNTSVAEYFAAPPKADRRGNYLFPSKWGIYRLEDDSIIIVQTIYRPAIRRWQNFNWSFREGRYKIVDRSTLKVISERGRSGDDRWHFEHNEQNQPLHLPAQFHPLPVKPPPNSWLKEHAEFFCEKDLGSEDKAPQ